MKKKFPINPKKIPYNLSIIILLAGACSILGFLSFSGMYALIPLLPLAFTAFALSVIYEGEIYLQNIKGAIKKLFKNNYLENHLVKEYLLAHFPKDTNDKECPQFFRDYKAQLELLSTFGNKELDKASRKRKKQVEKTLKDMEQWFASQLFPAKNTPEVNSPYAEELQTWLAKNQQKEWQEKINGRNFYYTLVKGFSILSGLFMGLGSTYLLVEAFSVIPFFAAIPFALWPIIILPMSVVAGAAYGLLAYNSITDLINNNTVMRWKNRLVEDLSKGLSVRNVFLTATALLLVGLAGALTVCTAGTWWTVATNARPLFEWMKSMPTVIMGVINPIITGFSAIFFNIQNSAETLDLVDEGLENLEKTINSEEGLFGTFYNHIRKVFKQVWDNENWLQLLNPFRILLKLTITPLRILLFLGHIISIGLTADRMPGLPQIVAALISMICESFEDVHYFIPHAQNDHEGKKPDFETLLKEHLNPNSGEQEMDIPTKILIKLAYPLYWLAAAWDFTASKLNKPAAADNTVPGASDTPTTFNDFLNKQQGIKRPQEVKLPENTQGPSKEWKVEHTVHLINKYQTKHFGNIYVGQDLAKDKSAELDALKKKVRDTESGESLAETLKEAKNQPIYNKHRLFAMDDKTSTQEFVEALPQRVGLGG